MRAALATSLAVAVLIGSAVCLLAAPATRWPVACATALTWMTGALAFWGSSRTAAHEKIAAGRAAAAQQAEEIESISKQTMSGISLVNQRIDASLQEIGSIAGQLREGVHTAVRCLQFQDSTTQLLTDLDRRTGAARAVIQSLTALAAAPPSDSQMQQLRLQQSLVALQGLADRNPVANRESAGGSVDLL